MHRKFGELFHLYYGLNFRCPFDVKFSLDRKTTGKICSDLSHSSPSTPGIFFDGEGGGMRGRGSGGRGGGED